MLWRLLIEAIYTITTRFILHVETLFTMVLRISGVDCVERDEPSLMATIDRLCLRVRERRYFLENAKLLCPSKHCYLRFNLILSDSVVGEAKLVDSLLHFIGVHTIVR